MQTEFDYVIVGAGSAGCTVAARLTEDPDVSVLLIEAGGWDRDPMIGIPLAWGRNVIARRHDWMYDTEPAPSLNGRRIPVYRGRVIGGSSSINAMAYVRGHRGDYERWAASGLTDWSYAHVLPYFRRSESWAGGANTWRGGEGPLTTCDPQFPDPLLDAIIEAGVAHGLPRNPDYNGRDQEGIGRGQATIRDGRRCSAAVAYLRPALGRAGLTVQTDTLVSGIEFEGARAVGVRLIGASSPVVRARREVLLCGGAINSPQLLMLSGIGDPEALARHGIAVRAALPGVGRNLQDHVSADVDHARRSPGPLHRVLRADRIGFSVLNAHFRGKGLAANLPNNVMAFTKSDPSQPIPDLQLLFRARPHGARPWFPGVNPAYADGFGCRPVPLRPTSRGQLDLVSTDPRAALRITSNFLSTDADRRTVRIGIRLAREIMNSPLLREFAGPEWTPGADKLSDEALDAYASATASTVYHPLGTCRMGADGDAQAVVDAHLRVRGVDGLRVIDASVMPDLVGGNINAPVIMIAERAADLIRGRMLPPADGI